MNNSNKNRLNYLRFAVIALLISIATGLVCDYFYNISPNHAVKIEKFQSQLISKEKQAAKTLENLKQIIIHSSVDSLIHYSFANNDISYYVFEKGELVFWSDNNLEISNLKLPSSIDWHYKLLPNAHCVSHMTTYDSFKILALISIKSNYPYQNNELVNGFSRGFEMDKQVQVVNGKKSDKLAVFCSHGEYLFSLSKPQTSIFAENWSVIGFIGYTLAFLIFLILYANTPYFIHKKILSINTFVTIMLGVGIMIGLSLYFNIPDLLFSNKLFSPFQYASNPLLTSICHLSVATGYLLATIYLFYFHVNTNNVKHIIGHVILLIMYTLYFAVVYYLLSGLIYHSSIQLTILQFNDFSVIKIWIHFLILLWGISLPLVYFKTHKWFKTNHRLKQLFYIESIISATLFILCFIYFSNEAIRLSLSYTAIWLSLYTFFMVPKYKKMYGMIAFWTFVFTAFIIYNSVIINNNKKFDKYKILAQNISINGNTENDRMADILLEELDIQILNDKKIGKLLAKTDSISIANEYLNKTYLRGFWNKYDMRLNSASIHSELYNIYEKFISAGGSCIKNTHFYSVPTNENNMSYIGRFQANTNKKDTLLFYMEFYPRRNFKSYSFPNLLIAASPDIQTKLDIAIAKYERQKLVYSSGKVEFPLNSNWISKKSSEFYSVIYNNRVHYIYAPNNKTQIVITEQQQHELTAYLFYFTYTFLSYFSICCLLVWGFSLYRHKGSYRIGLTAKFQYAFILLLIISFLLIFYVSVNFIEKKYQQEQIANLESKKSYIQKALQDMYYWNQDLTAQNMQTLNLDLQELSYIYHTDIHVYDNRGILVGSSQPIIFNKKLISNRIAPTPFFTQKANMNQYEHIGKLNYLTGYTDFYNGDYLQIGYIAVPQFFSQDEIRNEIESFLAVIIHIYLIIIVLVILVSLFIGKQLSAPLNMLENKLKEMRLGRRNEKIDYRLNDEIGQLVLQYNRTIDELEQSATLLAKSERESAWKSMARQVAHEINNPLTPMKLTIQQLQRTKNMNDGRFDAYFEKSAVMLIEQIDNLSRIAGTFSDFARMPEANFERVDVAAKLNSVVQLFINNNEQVQIDYHGAERNIFVFADPEQLVQVFNNLLKNAIQAIPSERKGKIKVSLKDDKQVIIKITDNGIGIVDEVHDKLFVPNFTTKTTGMGLGLAISKNIVELSGGTISFESKKNEGATFTVVLPKEMITNSKASNESFLA